MIEPLRPILSARYPRKSPANAIPSIVAYWNEAAAVMLRPNCLMICGMITPTESVVIANIMNIR